MMPGEMAVVHDDLTQPRREVDELTVCLEAVAERRKDHWARDTSAAVEPSSI
jgi:hypothetical protein